MSEGWGGATGASYVVGWVERWDEEVKGERGDVALEIHSKGRKKAVGEENALEGLNDGVRGADCFGKGDAGSTIDWHIRKMSHFCAYIGVRLYRCH